MGGLREQMQKIVEKVQNYVPGGNTINMFKMVCETCYLVDFAKTGCKYMVYDKSTKKIFLATNIRIDETKQPDCG